MMLRISWRFSLLFPGMLIVVGLQGCVATRGWVKQQITPLEGRLSDAEGHVSRTQGRLADIEGDLSQVGGRVSGMEVRLKQTDEKVERALISLANLRLERKFVLDLKQGANFAFNSSLLTGKAKREIDGFLSDLEGELREPGGTIFLVAGHTDSTGSEDYNYELGRKRAASVARYLLTHNKIDPFRVITASYGENTPLADNATREGRRRNRRVEILVYREAITSSPAGTLPRAATKGREEFESRTGGR
ncbi:MAG: OmpA family protein [Candidatus Binatia bacterium]